LSLWLAILLGGLITYLTRLSFIALFGLRQIPAWLQRALRFVPTAVFSAIILPELLLQDGKLDFSQNYARLIAGLLAILVAWRTRSILLTLLVGMAALLLLQALF